MILILWFIISLAMMLLGIIISYPWWFARLIQKRYWCENCHYELTTKARFLANYNAGTELDNRHELD